MATERIGGITVLVIEKSKSLPAEVATTENFLWAFHSCSFPSLELLCISFGLATLSAAIFANPHALLLYVYVDSWAAPAANESGSM